MNLHFTLKLQLCELAQPNTNATFKCDARYITDPKEDKDSVACSDSIRDKAGPAWVLQVPWAAAKFPLARVAARVDHVHDGEGGAVV